MLKTHIWTIFSLSENWTRTDRHRRTLFELKCMAMRVTVHQRTPFELECTAMRVTVLLSPVTVTLIHALRPQPVLRLGFNYS